MKTIQKISPIVLVLFLVSCASILPGNDKVLVNAQRTLTSGHEVVYSLYRIEAENYEFFKSKAPDQAKAVRRQVNVLRNNYPDVEKGAWNAVETYRTKRTAENKANVATYLAVFGQIVKDAQGYVSQINSSK